jgi:hypothetical protein
MMEEHFKPISVHAVNVLARLAAQREIKAQLAGEGRRVSMVRHSEIMAMAQAYLADHPKLYDEARALAERLGMFQRPSRRRPAVSASEDAKTTTEITAEIPAPKGPIQGSCLLNAYYWRLG